VKRRCRLILVRHGESEGNRIRTFTTEPMALALTDTGRQQAREAASKIARLFEPELVVASPFVRARETAEIIAAELKLSLEIEESLHERDMGALKGEPYEAVYQQPDYDPQHPWLWTPPEGESFEDVRRRVAPVFDRLAGDNHGRDLVVVSHGGVMMSIWAHVTGSWEGVRVAPNCGIVIVERVEGRYLTPQLIED
jgi:ribonuclease H / adenosylcobalamin/alpha-ribazole phosphatase